MPKEALYKQPSYNCLYPSEYNNTSSQSKVADSIRQAGDANESYVDHSIKPPLELLHGEWIRQKKKVLWLIYLHRDHIRSSYTFPY